METTSKIVSLVLTPSTGGINPPPISVVVILVQETKTRAENNKVNDILSGNGSLKLIENYFGASSLYSSK